MENAKRILFLVTQSEWGGAQSCVFKEALEAKRRGYEVLIAAGGALELKQRSVERNIAYHTLKKLRRNISIISDVQAIIELLNLFRGWKPSVLYLHSSKAGFIGSVAGRIARVPRIVYRIGGWSFLDPISRFQRAVRRWSEKLTARLKDVIIVLHPKDEALARRYGIRPKERLVVIPNGLDAGAFDAELLPRGQARAALTPGNPDAPLVMTVANFYATKDLVSYMEAIERVHQKHPRATFVIIGDGEERHAIESKRDALGLTGVVSLPGKRDRAATLLRGADVFVLPSAKEGMPWTLLEAMAAGIPCVATDVGANAWMLNGNGWVVPKHDPKRLSEAISDALAQPSRAREMAVRAREDVRKRFREQQMFDQTFEVIGNPQTP